MKKNLYNIKNVWELYFKKLNKYKLDDVYKNKNVLFLMKNKIQLNSFKKKRYKYLFDKYIKINPTLIKKIKIFKNKISEIKS